MDRALEEINRDRIDKNRKLLALLGDKGRISFTEQGTGVITGMWKMTTGESLRTSDMPIKPGSYRISIDGYDGWVRGLNVTCPHGGTANDLALMLGALAVEVLGGDGDIEAMKIKFAEGIVDHRLLLDSYKVNNREQR